MDAALFVCQIIQTNFNHPPHCAGELSRLNWNAGEVWWTYCWETRLSVSKLSSETPKQTEVICDIFASFRLEAKLQRQCRAFTAGIVVVNLLLTYYYKNYLLLQKNYLLLQKLIIITKKTTHYYKKLPLLQKTTYYYYKLTH